MKSSPLAAIALVLVNLVPLAGVYFRDWNLYTLAMIYWWECAIIGCWTVVKIGCATRVGPVGKTKAYKILLFLAHYCTAWVFYGAILSNLLFPEAARSLSAGFLFYLCLFLFMVSHALSFALNHIKRREYTKISALEQMFIPYRRLWMVHAVVVISLFIALRTGANPLAVSGVLALKTAVDLVVHVMGHGLMAQQRPSGPVSA